MDSFEQAIVRHQTYIQRLSASEMEKLRPVLRRLVNDATNLAGAGTITPAVETDAYALYEGLNRAITSEMADLTVELSQYELEYTSTLLSSYLSVETNRVSTEMAIRAITNSPMKLTSGNKVISETISEAVSRFSVTARKEVLRTIQSAAILGRPLEDSRLAVADLVKNRTVAQAQALVRTITNHISAEARGHFYKANAEFMEGEKWSATLDGKTSLTCMGLDGTIFPPGEGQFPPAHYNCRSVRVPIIKPELRVPGYKRERASMDGPEDAQLTYDGFLRKQDIEFQDDTLGPRRAKLFRAGMPIKRFTDDMGRPLTIEQIRHREGLTD